MMSSLIRVFRLLALSMSLAPLAWATNALSISPGAGSDAVLSLRTTPQGELRLTYNKQRVGASTESVTFGLSTDYSYQQSSSEGLTIRDYRLKRIFRIDPAGAFINDSMYAEVWYRGAELDNRANINGALAKAGLDPNVKSILAQQPFWAESQMGVTTTKFPRPAISRRDAKSEMSWMFDEEEIVKVRYRDEPTPPAIRSGLRRWWPSIAAIHPAIADDLAHSGNVPAELWVIEIIEGKTKTRVHWTLTKVNYEEKAVYPLPGGRPATPTEKRGAYPELFRLLSASVVEKRLPPPQSEYSTYATGAIAKSAGLEALVWTIEMQLASGASTPCTQSPPPEHCQLAAQAGPLAKADPRTAIAFAARSPDANARAQFESLPNAYLLRLLWATRPPGKDIRSEESELDLIAALKTRPLANFCKDAGDFYARQWNPFAAWQVYDFGRQMANHLSDDLLGNVDNLEAKLTADTATLF